MQEGQEGFRVVEQIQVEECETRGALQCVQQEQRLPCVSSLGEREKNTRVQRTVVNERNKTNTLEIQF